MAVYIDGLIAANSFEDASRIDASFRALPYIHDFDNYKPYEDKDHGWWISIVPKGIGYGVPYDSPDDRARFSGDRSKILANIYEHLRQCTGFKLALFGLEIGERFQDIDEGDERMIGNIRMPVHLTTAEGLIVSEHILPLFGTTEKFEPFSPGYYWIPRTDSWNDLYR